MVALLEMSAFMNAHAKVYHSSSQVFYFPSRFLQFKSLFPHSQFSKGPTVVPDVVAKVICNIFMSLILMSSLNKKRSQNIQTVNMPRYVFHSVQSFKVT